jgi:predicted O-linked N-acetylglucosamine transferase (SPINDLY family)
LNELGYEAYMSTPGADPFLEVSSHLRIPLLTPEIREGHRAAGCVPVAVYPEITDGNPLEAPVVARWVMNKTGHLFKQTVFSPNELFFYWNEWVLREGEKGERLAFFLIDRKIFNPGQFVQEKRSGFCYYANKYLIHGATLPEYIVQNGTRLCQDIPRSPRGIADILRRSEVLYCYEPSAIGGEAVLCGCPLVLVMTDYLHQFDFPRPGAPSISIFPEEEVITGNISIPPLDESAWNAYYDRIEQDAVKQLERFVEITQAAAKAHAEKEQTPARMLERGAEAFQLAYFGQASAIFYDLMARQPQNPLPPAYLAYIAAQRNHVLEARDFIDKASRIAPDRADLRAAMGEAFLDAGHPALAVDYLNEAVSMQPDLLTAYPALARALCLTGQSEVAVSLLQSAVRISSPAQTTIQGTLIAILTQWGDIDGLASAYLEFSRTLHDDLLAAHYLFCCDDSGERVLEALGRVQMRLAEAVVSECADAETGSSAETSSFAGPLKIAFMVGNFAREQGSGRLAALLRFRPPGSFTSLLLIGDPQSANSGYACLCSLLAEQTLLIHGREDAEVLADIRRAAPDVLINLDAYEPTARLAVFLRAGVKYRLLWGDAPMPTLSPDWRVLTGARLAENAVLPCVALPGMGECYGFPEWPLIAETQSTAEPAGPVHAMDCHGPSALAMTTSTPAIADEAKQSMPGIVNRGLILGCLTPAMRIGRKGWELFAEILAARPECQLLINLQDLADAAQDAICARFARAGVAAGRLRFVHAHSPEDFCRFWQETDLGLAPPVDVGDLALPGCLWMGRPYLCLASALPWARRAAALLELVGAAEWIVETPEAYIERARQNPPSPNPAFRARMQAAGLDDPMAFARGFAASMAEMAGANGR